MSHLPQEQEKLFMLARFLKYSEKDSIITVKKFLTDYTQATKEIRVFYNKTIDILLRTAL
jgi:hypothetical protein